MPPSTLLLSLSLAFFQPPLRMEPPRLALFFDAKRQSLDTLSGLPGAAFWNALPSQRAEACWLAPQGNRALLVNDSKLWAAHNLPAGVAWTEESAIARPRLAAWSGDGEVLYLLANDGLALEIYRIAEGRLQRKGRFENQILSGVRSLAVNRDGAEALASVELDGRKEIWRLSGEGAFSRLAEGGHSLPVFSAATGAFYWVQWPQAKLQSWRSGEGMTPDGQDLPEPLAATAPSAAPPLLFTAGNWLFALAPGSASLYSRHLPQSRWADVLEADFPVEESAPTLDGDRLFLIRRIEGRAPALLLLEAKEIPTIYMVPSWSEGAAQ